MHVVSKLTVGEVLIRLRALIDAAGPTRRPDAIVVIGASVLHAFADEIEAEAYPGSDDTRKRGRRAAAKATADPARDPKVWIYAKSSAKWHRIGTSRTPRATAMPGTEVLCGWKVQADPRFVSDKAPSECVPCNAEHRLQGGRR